MSAVYHFRPLKASLQMPEIWRVLDRAVARWVLIHGGSLPVAHAAGWASYADGCGDTALSLSGADSGRYGMPALSTDDWVRLRGDELVGVVDAHGNAPDGTPFVLDAERFYLRRNHAHETAVAEKLRRRCAASRSASSIAESDIDVLFHGDDNPAAQPQRHAVRQLSGRKLFVLTGGPGTGKTATVLRMLVALASAHAARGAAAPVIRLGAPTGKAAQRLAEALRAGAETLRLAMPARWEPHLQTALSAETGTLHRLLGSRSRHGGFRYHADHPLPADVVVVDEASMIDLDLLHALLDALRDDTVLILVGDADQLSSVGTGSVLLDLVAALETQAAAELVRLHHSFRADQALIAINAAILCGDKAAFAAAWQSAGAKALGRDVATIHDLRGALGAWCAELHGLLQQIGALERIPRQRGDLVLQALDGLRARQLLCALRETEFGTEAVNAAIERALQREFDDDDNVWYPGRAVMITRNDYALGLFNGDVGICLRDDAGNLGVWFEITGHRETSPSASVAPSGRRVMCLAPGSVPAHHGAFAITIHKSQGSEYGRVAILLPPDPNNRILSRQLLYTGASRAKASVEIWGTPAVVEKTITTQARRSGGLAQRLLAAGPPRSA